MTQETLWKTSTSVSSQGRQRGRAKGLMRRKNLNFGKKIGIGEAKILWSGLNVRLDRERRRRHFKPGERSMSESEYAKYVSDVQESQTARLKPGGRREKQTPLQRGWTSASPQGKKFAAPIEPNTTGEVGTG